MGSWSSPPTPFSVSSSMRLFLPANGPSNLVSSCSPDDIRKYSPSLAKFAHTLSSNRPCALGVLKLP